MSSYSTIVRVFGVDSVWRLGANGTSYEEEIRYQRIAEDVQQPRDGLTAEEIATFVTVFERAVAAGCTVERTVVTGVEVTHTVLGAEPPDAATLRTSAPQTADSDAPGTPESRPDEDTTPDEEPR